MSYQVVLVFTPPKTKMAIAGTKSRDFKKVQNGSVLL